MARTRTLRLALAQIDTTVGDIRQNADLIADCIRRASDAGAQIVVFPELSMTGYPPEDLLLKPHFLASSAAAVESVAQHADGVVALVGFAERTEATHNSLAVLADRRIAGVYRKMLLPNYGVFDERRYFEPGDAPALIEVSGVGVGLTVCEDIWFPGPPASSEALAGASLIVNVSASPYHRGKGLEREEMVRGRARETGAVMALCNAVGGQDELVFDGHSVVVDPGGETVARAHQFREELLVCELELPLRGDAAEPGTPARPARDEARTLASVEVAAPVGSVPGPAVAELLEPEEAEVYAALELGLRDYVGKNGFDHVVLALSGGIDSALVALLAADALGGDRVSCVVMPSPYSSQETQADARRLARNLDVETIELPIEPLMEAYARALGPVMARRTADGTQVDGSETADRAPGSDSGLGVAEENVQARIRGNVVMALSNRYGWLVLTTGNKSELSVGYTTLYGDLAGGFAVIKDVPKTLVYRLVRYRNERAGSELVPASILERAPSAELRPDQRDEDALPPYALLDEVLEQYVEQDRSREEMIAAGLPEEVVREVIAMVDRSEYKRRQAPPGIKISPKAFGRDRRLPITSRFGG